MGRSTDRELLLFLSRLASPALAAVAVMSVCGERARAGARRAAFGGGKECENRNSCLHFCLWALERPPARPTAATAPRLLARTEIESRDSVDWSPLPNLDMWGSAGGGRACTAGRGPFRRCSGCDRGSHNGVRRGPQLLGQIDAATRRLEGSRSLDWKKVGLPPPPPPPPQITSKCGRHD